MFEEMGVDLINHMGDDISIVNAARVSFDKESDYIIKNDFGVKLKEGDKKLIKYLAKHNHWSPFAHASLQFRIKAPVFVARQLVKHQIGFSWNEVSRRYVDTPPTYYYPEKWRKKDSNKKQGSKSNEFVENIGIDGDDQPSVNIYTIYEESINLLHEVYLAMVRDGVCPEQARIVLPVSHMTEWIWSGSVYGFARVCNLRLDSHAQYEVRIIAEKIDELARQRFPYSWEALREEYPTNEEKQ